MSPPRKSIQAINQDKPAAHEVFNYDSANRLQPPPSLPRRITHPSLPQGKELVTMAKWHQPHLASPEGEGQIILLPDYQSVIDIQGNQLLPYGGEREGADVHWLRKRECHKHSQIHENPDRNPITIYQLNKSVKKVKYVSSVKSVFKFLSIAVGGWTTLLSLINCFRGKTIKTITRWFVM